MDIGADPSSFPGVFVKLVFRDEIRKFKITESSSPYQEMRKFVTEQFVVRILCTPVTPL